MHSTAETAVVSFYQYPTLFPVTGAKEPLDLIITFGCLPTLRTYSWRAQCILLPHEYLHTIIPWNRVNRHVVRTHTLHLPPNLRGDR